LNFFAAKIGVAEYPIFNKKYVHTPPSFSLLSPVQFCNTVTICNVLNLLSTVAPLSDKTDLGAQYLAITVVI
jgi:hypothetical protein